MKCYLDYFFWFGVEIYCTCKQMLRSTFETAPSVQNKHKDGGTL